MKTRSSSKAVESSLPAVGDIDSFVRQVVSHSEKTSGSSSESLRRLYDWLKGVEKRSTPGSDPSLAELLIDGFDQEQIWQQIDVHNKFKLRSLKKCLSMLSETSHAPVLPSSSGVSAHGKSNAGNEQDDGEEEDEEDVDGFFEGADGGEGSAGSEHSEDDDEDEEAETLKRPSGKRSKVDDQFFSLQEMEAFLDQEDEKAMREGQGETNNTERLLDLDDGIESGQGADYRYEDFYGTNVASKSAGKKGKAVSFADDVVHDDDDDGNYDDDGDEQGLPGDEDDGNEEDDDEEKFGERPVLLGDTDESLPKSAFEERQERLRHKIEALEEENLKPKTWQMAGEATAESRDTNELLQEHLAFEHATKTVPIITQDTTEKLEALIVQRIKDRAFDDVERKVKPKDTPHKYRNELVLDQEKSKQSLAQVYEQEYIKQTEKTEVEQKNVQHEEFKKLMRNLFTKLDALSNFHYSPKPPSTEMRVINNMRSLTAEDVAPLAASDAALLAPEEVKIHAKGDVKSQEEKSATDKARDRRHKKSLAKVKADRKRKREAETGVSSDKMNDLKKLGRVKRTAVADTGKVKSSTFFSQLQNEVQQEVVAKRKKSQSTPADTKKSGAAFKL